MKREHFEGWISLRHATMLGSLIAAAAVLGACGRTVSSQGAKAPGADATAGFPCAPNACTDVRFAIKATGSMGDKFLAGNEGVRVGWTFSASPEDGKTRRQVGIRFEDLPEGAKSDKALLESSRIDWIPAVRGRGQKPLKVIVRDIDRCEALAGKSAGCDDVSRDFEDYEQVESWAWSIGDTIEGGGSDPKIVKVSDPNCAGATSTSNGQAIIQGISAGTQVLGGLFGPDGNPLGTLAQYLPSAFSNGSSASEPDQC